MSAKAKPSIKSHGLCRPPSTASEIKCLLKDGTWIDDNGASGIAFSYKIGNAPYAFVGNSKCNCSMFDPRCPLSVAMEYTAKRWGCANGRRSS